MKPQQFICREGDIEVRANPKRDMHGDNVEIVKWEGATCYTVAYWDGDRDGGHNLTFVGDRPFKLTEPEREVFWRFAHAAQTILGL